MPTPQFVSTLSGLLHRSLVVLALTVLVMAGWGMRGALAWEESRLMSQMASLYGEPGVGRLKAWLSMLRAQTGLAPQQQTEAVNEFWNQYLLGGDDRDIWKDADYWATVLESLGKGAGDCEDYVIAKYFSLLHLGVPEEKLRFIYVRARIGGIGSTQSIAHMVLGYYETPQSEPMVMDNLVNRILPASQRNDLTPVFSFNAQGIYVAGAQPSSVSRISRWQGLMEKMKKEGFLP
jgi:predicted transglutaminase-like cysteine proteinase